MKKPWLVHSIDNWCDNKKLSESDKKWLLEKGIVDESYIGRWSKKGEYEPPSRYYHYPGLLGVLSVLWAIIIISIWALPKIISFFT